MELAMSTIHVHKCALIHSETFSHRTVGMVYYLVVVLSFGVSVLSGSISVSHDRHKT